MIARGVLTTFIRLPIWFFLMYTILSAIHPDRLVWFLLWIYIPLSMALELFDTFGKAKAMAEVVDKEIKKQFSKV